MTDRTGRERPKEKVLRPETAADRVLDRAKAAADAAVNGIGRAAQTAARFVKGGKKKK